MERPERLLVVDRQVADPPAVAEGGVLRPDSRIVQAGGDRMRGRDLPVRVLEQIAAGAVEDAGPAATERGCVTAVESFPRGLDTVQGDGIIEEGLSVESRF